MSNDQLLDELIAQWQRYRGESREVTAAELCADRPELLPELQRRLKILQQMERLAQPDALGAPSCFPTEATTLPPADKAPVPPAEAATLPPSYGGDACPGERESSPAQTPPSERRERVAVPGYEILSELGRGGMGVVYKARQLKLDRVVALKMVLAGGHAAAPELARFRTEAEAIARQQHPNIVQVFEIGEQNGLPFFSLEFCSGGSLEKKLAGTPLPPQEAARLVEVLARAMEHAHKHGVIHRDLKPANVLLLEDGTPKITDFGLAKKVEETGQTATGAVMGTPSYMAPEQAGGKKEQLGPATDVYALGAILYECLTGRPPFRAASALDTVLQVMSEEPVSPRRLNPKVPRDLETICQKCLEKPVNRRYASAADLADELQRFLNGEPIQARPLGSLGWGWRWCKRRPVVAGLSAAVVLLVLFVAIASPLVAVRQRALRQVAVTRAEEARVAREKTEVTLVDMYTSAGLVASERGDPAQAVLWFANAARLAGIDPQRERANRIRVRTWSRQVPTPVRALWHDGQPLRSLQFHADGKHLLTLTVRDKCTVWDIENERPLPSPGGDRQVRSAAFSPDGRWLALGMPQGHVEIFSFPAGELLHRIEHRGPVTALAFSRNGNRLALASNVVRVWDCQSHSFATPELVHPRQVLALAFSANGARLATGCEDLQARVFAIAGQLGGANPLFPPVGHRLRENEHMHMPISPTFIDQDRGLLTVTDPRTVAWRDAGTGEQLRPVPAEAPAVSSIAVSPDGRHFALGSWEKTSLWEVTAGRRIGQQPSQEHMVVSATFSPDGATLITGSMNTARPWSIPAGEPVGPVLRHQGRVLHAAYSADGRLFATADQRGLVRVWIITLGNHPDQRLPLEGKATALRLSCDGCYLIATGSSWPAACLPSARVYDASTFQPAGPPLRPGGIVTGADLSPDGRHAVTLNTLGQAHFWDWRTGEKSMEPVATPSEPRAVRYTPDGRLAIVACVGGQVLAVDASTGQVTRRLQHGVPYDRTVRGSLPGDAYLDISSDGRRFLSCSIDGFVRICETATGRPCYRPLQHANIPGMGRFSPDAQLLLTAARDSTVRVWDATSGGPTGRVLTHPTYIDDACISPDGQHVLTACTDGMARLWDWRTGILVCPPFQHARHVPGACFTPDGVFVLTTAFDLTARVWEWHTGKPVTPPLSISGYGIRVLTTPDGSHAFVSGMASFIDVISLRDLYARDEIERDDLCTLGEILSGQRLHEGGDVVNLTADEWLERWRRFRQRYPEYSRLDWPPEQVIAWHRREADKNLRAEQWFTAVWHLDRLIAREPKNWRHYRDRSQAHRALGQKDAADADQARASARKKSHE